MVWMTLVRAEELATAEGVALFDCRFDLAEPEAGRARFLAGHLPGARFLDLEADLSGRPDGINGRHPLPDRATLAARLAELGLNAGQQVVVYDDAGGMYAARGWWLLRWLGHEAVALLDGGIQAWAEAGLTLVDGDAPIVMPGSFVATPAPGMPIVGADDVLASLDDASLLVVDARSPERFRGEPNPLDPVTGHIPGARNRFFRDNLGQDGRFKRAAALRVEYRALLGDRPTEKTALQCGSGVTAAHDLLAMAHAGLDGAALYPGSWSEWISDPARPVERD